MLVMTALGEVGPASRISHAKWVKQGPGFVVIYRGSCHSHCESHVCLAICGLLGVLSAMQPKTEPSIQALAIPATGIFFQDLRDSIVERAAIP